MKVYDRSHWEGEKPADKGETNCPFCNVEGKDTEDIIWKGKYWHIRHNIYPYNGTMRHLLAIPYAHEKYTKDLSLEIWADYQNVEAFMYDFYNEGKYFSFIREIGNAKSLNHLHYHFLPGEIDPGTIIEMLKNQGIQSDI